MHLIMPWEFVLMIANNGCGYAIMKKEKRRTVKTPENVIVIYKRKRNSKYFTSITKIGSFVNKNVAGNLK